MTKYRARFAATMFALTVTACTDPNSAREALLDAGYTDITIGKYDPWACGKEDHYATSFVAKGPTGREVRGTVCSGVWKGETIRLKRGRD